MAAETGVPAREARETDGEGTVVRASGDGVRTLELDGGGDCWERLRRVICEDGLCFVVINFFCLCSEAIKLHGNLLK